jgi:hypothetical protein
VGFKLLPCLVLVFGRGFEDREFVFGDVSWWLVVLDSEDTNNVLILGDWLRVKCGALKDIPDTRITGLQEYARAAFHLIQSASVSSVGTIFAMLRRSSGFMRDEGMVAVK